MLLDNEFYVNQCWNCLEEVIHESITDANKSKQFSFYKEWILINCSFHIENTYRISIHYPSLIWLKNFFCFITQRAWFLNENIQSSLKHAVKHKSFFVLWNNTHRYYIHYCKFRFPSLHQGPCPQDFLKIYLSMQYVWKKKKKPPTNYPVTEFNYFTFAIALLMGQI